MGLSCALFGHIMDRHNAQGAPCRACSRCDYQEWTPLPRPKPAPGQLVIMKREEQFAPRPVSPTAHSRWRPHTEPPDLGTIALIALEVDADPFLLGDLYEATDDGWRSEETGDPLHVDAYHWLPERELLAGLRAHA